MKSIRKSLNGNKSDGGIRAQISTPVPLPAVSKPPSAILPPQKVIRAMAAHRPQAPQELPFQKGDFFYVLRDFEGGGNYYEAHNPVTGARGLVPKDLFEEFSKTSANLRTLGSPNPNNMPPQTPRSPQIPLSPMSPKSPMPKTQVFYAIVLHDFMAERADELDAKRGDAITVVAQSNREWFVAKPIGRLGRPGLIPVSFVEIHDPSTGKPIPDVNALMDRGDLPKVEDWKRAMFNYKQNSIALGVIDSPNPRDSVPNSPFMPTSPYLPQNSPAVPPEPAISVQQATPHEQSYSNDVSNPPPPETPDVLPDGILLAANVVSFHFEMEEYWFRVDAVFQPYASSPEIPLPPAKSLILFRVYNDFYDFQVSLLDSFPREAGRQPPHPRLLPYMPGPADNVDDALTATRRSELDEYVVNLCHLSTSGGRYILEHNVVREFLALKPGDVENIIPPRIQDMDALFAQGRPYDEANDVQDSFGRMKVQDDESEYEDEGYAPSPQQSIGSGRHPYGQFEDRRDSNSLRIQAHTQNHQRTGSSSSLNHSPYSRDSRAESPLARSRSPPPSRWNENGHNGNGNGPPITSSPSSSSLHSSSRSRSGSVANVNSPTISAANPQTAFVKIKIFDRVADDLIAIRVHPRVTHMELMDKVQSRLGGEVARLKYRDSMSNQFVGVDNDQQLRAWIEGTDKHVLYAD